MDIQQVRSTMRMKSIFEIPMRVTFYARVSSESDEQLNSLDNQVAFYENLIKKNTAWTYVAGYIDEGISGISTKKRKRFNQMIKDAKDGLFDLIITKEISRFARNTLDSLQFTRELLHCGVGVFFQNDNINTLDEDAELRLTIMSSIAQDELRKLSSRVDILREQVKDYLADSEKLRSENAALRTEVERLKEELRTLKEKKATVQPAPQKNQQNKANDKNNQNKGIPYANPQNRYGVQSFSNTKDAKPAEKVKEENYHQFSIFDKEIK